MPAAPSDQAGTNSVPATSIAVKPARAEPLAFDGLMIGSSLRPLRATEFIRDAFTPTFDIDTGNVVEANPTRQRPDLCVDERKKTTPFFNALHKGTLADITPFTFPRFNSASGVVADHVEGVEPTPGAFDMTNQTVTPSAVSGKVEVTREVWDQGGNPQVSNLIWNKMVYAYYQAMEAKAVALLDAASPTQIALAAGTADDTLVDALEAALADLNFVAGGNTFNFAGTQQDLYRKLTAAVDTNRLGVRQWPPPVTDVVPASQLADGSTQVAVVLVDPRGAWSARPGHFGNEHAEVEPEGSVTALPQTWDFCPRGRLLRVLPEVPNMDQASVRFTVKRVPPFPESCIAQKACVGAHDLCHTAGFWRRHEDQSHVPTEVAC